ncbi:tryptophan-rich sensory protein TspO [Frigidibacter oleivorans]|uniref:tryptophan-rich sensory protein TspO n=1 Tax=Frigidibacter oleivorans TaxID=2487129 RepID=UPI000F8F7CDB|nr:TspO/MBR family protein [Frigidibacter oleivorans]
MTTLPLFLTFLAACVAAGATGFLFKPGPWYDGLRKPSWTPPNWAFPVVWTVLYLLMAWAAARVAVLPGNGQALAFWAMQIALNTLWTPVFFGLHRMLTGLLVMGALLVAVVGTLVTFWTLDTLAGLMILPYLAWLAVAAALNLWIWRFNPKV